MPGNESIFMNRFVVEINSVL